MELVKIGARIRAGRGKSYTRKALAAGWIPAVCYGHKQKTHALEINSRDFAKVVRNKQSTHLLEMIIEGGETFNAVIKEVQKDVLKNNVFLHIDFQHVDMKEKISVQVPVEIVGIPEGVKTDGGILNHPVREVTVECLPHEMLDKLVVDVSALKIGQSIHVRDLVIEKGEIKDSPDEVIATVSLPSKDAAAAAAETADAAATVPAAAGAKGAAPAKAPAGGKAPAAAKAPAAGKAPAGGKK